LPWQHGNGTASHEAQAVDEAAGGRERKLSKMH
jgi:hypothetical protein